MYCFLDMDGVLADFVDGVCQAHDRVSPYEDPNNYGHFDMEPLWGMSSNDFWKPTNHEGFWFGLSKTNEADLLVEIVTKKFGIDNIAILTAPSLNQYCIPEKRAWVRAYYPQLANQMIFSAAKKFLAGPDRILIDDRTRNIKDFNNAFGHGITLPRLWNDYYHLANDPIKFIHEELNTLELITNARGN